MATLDRPNFFLLGAPKSGTTALAEYLASHPAVLFSQPKEAKYFHTDFHPSHRLATSLEGYLRMFGGRREMARHQAVGEGTVWYLYSDAAVPNILRLVPDARFLVLLRNPPDLVHSLHAQLLYGGDENVESFAAAWRLQERRRRGEAIPPFCREPKVLQYGAVGSLGFQMARLFSHVPPERVLPLLFDDLCADPRREYRRALDFLHLGDDGRRDFPIVNPNRVVHRPRTATVVRVGAAVKRGLGLRRSLGVWRRLSPLLSRRQRRDPLPPDLRHDLEEHFREDVDRLATLLERDLSAWRS